MRYQENDFWTLHRLLPSGIIAPAEDLEARREA